MYPASRAPFDLPTKIGTSARRVGHCAESRPFCVCYVIAQTADRKIFLSLHSGGRKCSLPFGDDLVQYLTGRLG